MSFTKTKNILGLTVFPDFEKAFNCFERNYLQKCLETFNFGPQLQQWIYVMYSILNDGFATKQFKTDSAQSSTNMCKNYIC